MRFKAVKAVLYPIVGIVGIGIVWKFWIPTDAYLTAIWWIVQAFFLTFILDGVQSIYSVLNEKQE